MTASRRPLRWEEGASRQALRWGMAAVLVATVHAGAAWGLMNWPQDGPSDPTGAAVLVELAPLPVSPEPMPEIAPGPPMAEAEPEPQKPAETPQDPPPEPEPPPPEPAPPEPPPPEPVPPEPSPEPAPPQPEPLPESEPMPEPEPLPRPVVEVPDITVPELPDVPDAAAVLTPPAPPPPPPRMREPVDKKVEKRERPKPRRIERRREVERKDKRVDRSAALPSSDAPPSQTAAAPSQGVTATRSQSPATWRNLLVAHLKRHQRFPSDARVRREEGTAHVAFTIDRSGRVLTARLVKSSGHETLDREAVATIQRASPVPAPPSEFGGARISLAVPVRFDLR